MSIYENAVRGIKNVMGRGKKGAKDGDDSNLPVVDEVVSMPAENKSVSPKVGAVVHPGDFRVGDEGPVNSDARRHISRLSRLMLAAKKNPENLSELREEIARRKASLKVLGIDAPDTPAECEQMLKGV